MKYNLLEIVPVPIWDDNVVIGHEWKAFVKHLMEDCHERPCEPDPCGFLYFPTDSDVNVAFVKLKGFLVEKHQKEIERLEKSMRELRNVTL